MRTAHKQRTRRILEVISLGFTLFQCPGLQALLQSSVGDQGKRDDDYGNEKALRKIKQATDYLT